jgi:endo-1,4-beta-xylanase
MASLLPGTKVNLLGTYGDFVQVGVLSSAGATGFVWKNSMENLPSGLPVLDSLQVPWEPLYSPKCLLPKNYDPGTNSVTITSGDETWYGLESAAWSLPAPVRIQISNLRVEGEHSGGISVLGINPGEINPDIWWQGITRMTIKPVDGKYVLEIHNGSSENFAYRIYLKRSVTQPIQIVFDQGTSITVLDENNQVLETVDLTNEEDGTKLLPSSLFPTGKLFFGIGVDGPNTSLVVSGLSVGIKPSGRWIEESVLLDYLNIPGLVTLAKDHNLSIGTDFLYSKMIDLRYCTIMQRDFNVAIVSDFTYIRFWLGEGEYDWGPVDHAVDFAIQHGWRVRASHLVWGAPEAIPDWLLNSNYTRDEYITILKNHINTVIEHFRGRVQEWNIANEAIERIVCERADFYDFWYRKIGPDYIKVAFQTAREADPRGILILNSGYNYPPNYPPFMNCLNPTINTMHETVIALNSGATRLVDVIGMQMHNLTAWDTKYPPGKADVIQIMKKFSALGVRVYITEMDVNLTFIQNNYPTQEERWAYQAGIYKDMVDACLESGACDSFATWGISDSESWITTSCRGCWNEPSPNGDPLMFDNNFLPKPAYFAVRDTLASTNATATPNP